MCGRFFLILPGEELARLFGLPAPPEVAPRYNIAPTQGILAVRQGPAGREAAWLRWGWQPGWAQGRPLLINARGEGAAGKPAFAAALRRRRCLIPASGFLEWRREAAGKRPFAIRLAGGGAFAMAGLWTREEQGPEERALILTTTPNATVAPIHDRMPAILDPAAWAAWLDPDFQEPARLTALLAPYASGPMEAIPVDRRVNDARHDDPSCLAPAGEE